MEFYENNYKDFSNTRYCLWKSVNDFSKQFSQSSNVLDAGCGNGKNMLHLQHLVATITGFDNCKNFVTLCNMRGLHVIEGDIINPPYEDNTFDFIICIAVIHHLKHECDRTKAMNELLRILKPGGKVLLTVWAVESDAYSKKRKFIQGDNNVLFNKKDRYYFVHDKNSFKEYCEQFSVEKEIFWDKGNWNVIFTKSLCE